MSNQSRGRPGGVLPIHAAATKKPATSQKTASKTPAPRLKLIVRRLPPGLTEVEFWEALGTDWQVGHSRVEWFVYKTGKISSDPSKPSRPSRAYLKVKDQALLEDLSNKIRQAQFRDAKNSSNDACLIGPPSLEFAPYGKVLGGRLRNDGRQGTIDQDPEFIDFLQSLTEPITRQNANGGELTDVKLEKLTTTPLVQFIKEKKANKAKEKEAAASAKQSKKLQETKDSKTKAEARPAVQVKSTAGTNTTTADKSRSAKAATESIKVVAKPAATPPAAATTTQSKASTTKADSKAKEASTPPASAAKKERERGNVSAAARLISRDLGLTPREPRTPRTTRNGSSAAVPAKATNEKAAPNKIQESATSAPVTPGKPAPSTTQSAAPPSTGGRNTRAGTTPSQAKENQPATQRNSRAAVQNAVGARSAFLKHANPSQGVTEELVRTTFAVFGAITKCEIDKKKGLGYVDFADPESLKKAMAASPVKVGSGQVTVLENRSSQRKNGQQRGNEGNSTAVSVASTTSRGQATAIAEKTVATTPSSATTTDSLTATMTTTVATDSANLPKKNVAVTSTSEQVTQNPTSPANASSGQGPAASRAGKGGANNQRGGKAVTNSAPVRGGSNNRGNRGGRGGRGRGARGGNNANTGNANSGSAQTPAGSSTPAA